MRIFKILPVLALAATLFQGCSNSTTPNPPATPVVTYTANTTYIYKQNRLDTTGGAYGLDKVNPTATDTITTTVVAVNQTYQGKSSVTFLENKHSLTGLKDTSYIAQESGNYWHYNYGLDLINDNPAAVGFLGGPAQSGWVLQAKLGASKGDTWTADSTLVKVPNLGNASLTIRATEQADTTIMVGTTSISAKHVLHTVTLSSVITITGYIDTYVSSSTGMTLDIVHSSGAIPALYPKQIPGSQTLLLSH